MSFPYKKVLLIGATSGIGRALADKLVENGVFVIAIGRRKEKLEEFVAKHGKGNVDATVFDAARLDAGKPFIDEVFTAHPDIDFVYLNFGIQRGIDYTKPDSIDFPSFNQELVSNYMAPAYLTAAILPHLQDRSNVALGFTTSQLALVTLTRSPNYGASKAALHSFIIALRAQLAAADITKQLKIIEVYPPAVQTEMHDSKHQPDLKNGGEIGMPLAEFTDELYDQLCKGNSDVAIGTAKEFYDKIERTRVAEDLKWNEKMNEALKDFTA